MILIEGIKEEKEERRIQIRLTNRNKYTKCDKYNERHREIQSWRARERRKREIEDEEIEILR